MEISQKKNEVNQLKQLNNKLKKRQVQWFKDRPWLFIILFKSLRNSFIILNQLK